MSVKCRFSTGRGILTSSMVRVGLRLNNWEEFDFFDTFNFKEFNFFGSLVSNWSHAVLVYGWLTTSTIISASLHLGYEFIWSSALRKIFASPNGLEKASQLKAMPGRRRRMVGSSPESLHWPESISFHLLAFLKIDPFENWNSTSPILITLYEWCCWLSWMLSIKFIDSVTTLTRQLSSYGTTFVRRTSYKTSLPHCRPNKLLMRPFTAWFSLQLL